MKKIIVSSFMGSGSSAVTDLLSEYNNINCKNKDFEYIFLHCPNGLFDLEDKLLIGNTMVRSDEALRSFEQTMKNLYFNKKWWFANYREKVSPYFIDNTTKFIERIVDLEFEGYWYEHEKINSFDYYLNMTKGFINRFLKTKLQYKKLYQNRIRVSFIENKKFYNEAKEYINSFFNLLSETNDSHLVLDQLILPYNLNRINNYFDDDTKFIIVHRDPRDVYLLNKYIWSANGSGVPFPLNVADYCTYYKKIMNLICDYSQNENILNINFEDLIYNYENTKEQLEQFCEIDSKNHLQKKKRFNPEISKNNTNISFDFNNAKIEVEFIQDQLKKYLYIFDQPNCLTNKNKLF